MLIHGEASNRIGAARLFSNARLDAIASNLTWYRACVIGRSQERRTFGFELLPRMVLSCMAHDVGLAPFFCRLSAALFETDF
jgi:hypothetical protein